MLIVLRTAAAAVMQTGYLPWSWGDFKSISQIDVSNNKLSGWVQGSAVGRGVLVAY
jgi:hypothetical protein